MIRLVAFILTANDKLMFCKRISTDDEPALWQKSFGDDNNSVVISQNICKE